MPQSSSFHIVESKLMNAEPSMPTNIASTRWKNALRPWEMSFSKLLFSLFFSVHQWFQFHSNMFVFFSSFEFILRVCGNNRLGTFCRRLWIGTHIVKSLTRTISEADAIGNILNISQHLKIGTLLDFLHQYKRT